MTRRLLADVALVPMIEPGDKEAGIDSETILLGSASLVSLLLQFGAVTGDAVLKLYSGATAGAKTTALAFTYRLSAAAYKAAAADTYGADVAVASTGLTLTAASFANRTMVIDLEVAAMTADQPWLTAELSAAATVLFVSAVAALGGSRYKPAATMVPTT